MTTRSWWRDAVFYEVYPRSFRDSNGDGNGDLPGLISGLDHLEKLGVDALWLTPIYRSPMRDNGYDVADHRDIDPLYGTLADLDRLVAALRARGMRLVLDFVANHTSDEHPWFAESRSSRASPRRDWYIWRDPAADGGPPNNWLSHFGGPAWTLDAATGQYYAHSFLPCQPDLDWSNPRVRAAMLDILAFWLDRGADGFRVDALGQIAKHPALADDPPHPDWRPGDPEWKSVLRVNSADRPELAAHVREMRATLARSPRDPVLMGETYAPAASLARLYGDDMGGMQLPTNMNLIVTPWTPRGIATTLGETLRLLPNEAAINWVVGNHDRPRAATRLGADQARVAMLLLLTLRGAPTIYQGDELGLEDVPVPPDAGRDTSASPRLRVASRDPERTPLPWRDGPGAGFTTGRPWLPLGPEAGRRSIARQDGDPGSMLALTRALLALRRREPAFRVGAQTMLDVGPDAVAYGRTWNGRQWIVAFNPSAARAAPLARPLGGPLALSLRDLNAAGRETRMVELPPGEGVILGPLPAADWSA
jgi:alpha-glucosidase